MTDSAGLCRDSKGSLQGLDTYGLFCVFDGHNGAAAAQHLEDNLHIVSSSSLSTTSRPA